MREIKFRGKSDDEWVYGMLIKTNEGDTEHGENYEYQIQTDEKEYGEYTQYFVTDNNTIGQYTGLKDKNGKEIYEGDIVRVLGGCYEQGFYEIDETEIIEDFVKDTYDLMMVISQLGENCVEVIGNIYDNPELLEVKDE